MAGFTAQVFVFGQILTSAQMNANQLNFTAVATGDATNDTPPEIQTAAIADDAINFDKITSGGVSTPQIRASAVTRVNIASAAVSSTKFRQIWAVGSLAVGGNSQAFIPEGIYQVHSSDNITVELLEGATWRSMMAVPAQGMVWSDGSLMRARNVGAGTKFMNYLIFD